MIVFSAFVPHSPLLIESISKDRYHKFDDTHEAIKELRVHLEASRPDVIITLSAHANIHDSVFSLHLHESYRVDLTEFGDHATTKSFQPDLELASRVRRHMRTENLPLTLGSGEVLNYGAGVPLLLLTDNLHAKVLPISYSGLDAKTHLAFGRMLKDVFMNSSKRIAVIASGDLSHCLSTDAPMGFKKEGQLFDDAVLEAVRNVSSAKLLTIPARVVKNSSECAYRPLLLLFGILERMNVRPEILSYEAPFGVGYLVAAFRHPHI